MSGNDQDVYFQFQQRFNQAVAVIKSNKCTNTILLNRAEYDNLIEQVKIAKSKQRKRSPNDYKRLKRYDVIEECGTERLISPILEDDVGIRYFVHVEEIFDILHQIHLQLDHGGRVRMEHQLTGKYNNITKELITLYLRLCQICQKRNRGEGDLIRKRPNHPKALGQSRAKHPKQRDVVILKTEKAVVDWLEEKTLGGQQVSDRELRDKALQLYAQFASTEGNLVSNSFFKASKDWLFRFREKFHIHMNSRQQHQTVVSNHLNNSTIAIIDQEMAASAVAAIASASSRTKFHAEDDPGFYPNQHSNSGYSYPGVQLDQLIDPVTTNMVSNDVEDEEDKDEDDDDEEDGSNWNYRKFSEVFQAASYLTDLITKFDPNQERSRLISRNVNHNLKPYREMFDILRRHERKLCINVNKRIKQQHHNPNAQHSQPSEVSVSESSSVEHNPNHQQPHEPANLMSAQLNPLHPTQQSQQSAASSAYIAPSSSHQLSSQSGSLYLNHLAHHS